MTALISRGLGVMDFLNCKVPVIFCSAEGATRDRKKIEGSPSHKPDASQTEESPGPDDGGVSPSGRVPRSSLRPDLTESMPPPQMRRRAVDPWGSPATSTINEGAPQGMHPVEA